MNDEYVETFLRESEENVVDLNNSLLALEDDPTDREAIDLIFRTAHTVKGNFAAMGFSRGSELAHAIEDLLEEIREGHVAVTPDVMDRLFAGVDGIETIVAEVDRTGEATTDSTATIEDLRAVVESSATEDSSNPSDSSDSSNSTSVTPSTASTASTAQDEGGSNEPELPAVALLDDDRASDVESRVYRAHLELTDGDMKGVDGMLVLEAAAGRFELLGSAPDHAAIEDGEYDGGFDLLVSVGDDADADVDADVEAFFRDVSKVESVTVIDVTGEIVGGTADEQTRGPDGVDDPGDESPSVDAIRSVRVDVGQLDDLYSLVEQLVTSRIKLRRSIEAHEHESTTDNLDELDKITADLQNTVMDVRLIPLRKVVNAFPRLVRDVARAQGKDVDFAMEGTDVELDRTILDEIGDPLMHVLRNAVGHGIESPDERQSVGKPRAGSIRLRAARTRDYVDVVVEDDGAGIDADAIRRKAVETAVLTEDEADAMDDEAVYDLIFHPGFSTTDEVTDVSGRGVGMDVVSDTVSRLDGSASVAAEPGEGTTVRLRLPVTVAIVQVLFVEVADRVFGLPIKDIDEITPVGGIETIDGRPVIDHDDSIYPVLDLRERLAGAEPTENGDGMLLRIRESARPVALRCDAVGGQEEVVTKPFEGVLRDVQGMSGTAIVGDGRVVPIIDVATL